MHCHFPGNESPEDLDREKDVARIVLEEFFLFQIALLFKRKAAKRSKAIPLRPGKSYRHLFKTLPFRLTAGQDRVRCEIETDMAGWVPMNRLLQGDVGCGKTVVAVLAAAMALDSGCQVVFMAPTEILAEQHYLSIHRMLEGIGIEPVLVRGNMGAERSTVLGKIAKGARQSHCRHPCAPLSPTWSFIVSAWR